MRACAANGPAATRGFTLVEVMVSLIIIAVGLLGIAKLQAVALSNTGSAGKRSLAALEAAGFASAMHADRGYWASSTVALTTTVTGTTFTSSDSALSSAAVCAFPASCTLPLMASYDLLQWATSLNSTLGSTYSGVVACTPPSTASPGAPATCSITLTWIETAVAAGTNQATAAQANATAGTIATIQQPVYILYVTP